MLRLQLRFLSLADFKREFEKNIAHGGAFVETDEDVELQETVEVALDLTFCGHLLVLEAEVVNRLPAGARGPTGGAGVAVQFTESAHMLRLLLAGMADLESPRTPAPWPERSKDSYQERTTTDLLATLEAHGRRQSVLVVNLSLSGALLDLEGAPTAVGTAVVVVFRDPVLVADVPVEGRVVRHVPGSEGRSRIGVAFNIEPGEENTSTQTLDRLLGTSRSAQQTTRRIVGDLGALGLPSLLQLFSTGAEQGTLALTRGAREASVLFERGSLRHVEVGGARSLKALARLLEWSDGRFEFRPTLDSDSPQTPGIAIDAALLEAMQHYDELQRLDTRAFPPGATVASVAGARAPEELEKIARAVLERTAGGIVVAQLLDSIDAFDDEIYAALATLHDLELIRVT